MAQIIDFVIEITYQNKITTLEVDYPVDIKLENVLEEIYDHVGVKQNEKDELEVTIGKLIVSRKQNRNRQKITILL